MSTDYIPGSKPELQIWIANFVTVCNANLNTLALTPADISILTALQTNFISSVTNSNTARQNLKSTTAAETLATKNMVNDVRVLVRRFQANTNVLPALKESLGVSPRNTPKNHAPPITPTGLMVEGFATGVNRVTWKRSGNKPTTVFRVQAQIGTATDFVEVGSVPALTFDHIGQAPGVKVAYRVVAYRAKQTSVPSTEVVVYNNNNAAPVLSLQKAA